jgi:hypothetical protein
MSFVQDQARAWEEIREWAQEAESQPLIPVQPGGSWDGPGSALAATQPVIDALPALLARLGVLTMLDLACGDWNWMRYVDLGDIEYTGWDVDPGRIARCNYRIGIGDFTTVDRPNVHFEQVNALTAEPDQLSEWDLILARDFFAHLPTGHVMELVSKIKRGSNQWLLASTYPHCSDNTFVYNPAEYAWNGYMEHPINLEIEPFTLHKVDSIVETPGPGGVLTEYHELGLFQVGSAA